MSIKLSYLTLDNNRVSERVVGHFANKSNLHLEARALLKDAMPLAQVLEEVKVRLYYRAPPVFFDFYIPVLQLFIEVQGQQHYEYVQHFHGNKREFAKSAMRDKDKQEWCDLNSFSLLILRYDERHKWAQMISSSK